MAPGLTQTSKDRRDVVYASDIRRPTRDLARRILDGPLMNERQPSNRLLTYSISDAPRAQIFHGPR